MFSCIPACDCAFGTPSQALGRGTLFGCGPRVIPNAMLASAVCFFHCCDAQIQGGAGSTRTASSVCLYQNVFFGRLAAELSGASSLSSCSKAEYMSRPFSHFANRHANGPPSPFSIRWRSPYHRPPSPPSRASNTSSGLHQATERNEKTASHACMKVLRR